MMTAEALGSRFAPKLPEHFGNLGHAGWPNFHGPETGVPIFQQVTPLVSDYGGGVGAQVFTGFMTSCGIFSVR
jgi:hypothetical protein